ncbi:MAG: MoxR family ATPase [bacterium]|nr:MoxR family ATPase [bacterium]
MNYDKVLADWRPRALEFGRELGRVLVEQERPIRLITIAVFSRGHVLLEGGVGMGKTTMLKAVARALGGGYSRVEGSIDLKPGDLLYYHYITEGGQIRVDQGPLLEHGENLTTFFFNEVNRARPEVHAPLLNVMEERFARAFNRIWRFPYLLVFADRNRVEKEETFELAAAHRDRFLMEVLIDRPQRPENQILLFFDTKFQDPDALIKREVTEGLIPYRELHEVVFPAVQNGIGASAALKEYVRQLWDATWQPDRYGVKLEGKKAGDFIDPAKVIEAGASTRGGGLLVRAARTAAWLSGHDTVLPEDLHDIFFETVAHRVFFKQLYEGRRSALARELMTGILENIPAPA